MKFRIDKRDEVTSTNTVLRQLADQGAEEGLVLTSEFQTEGRGKPGREWISPRGKNLLFSILLKPSFDPAKAPLMTQTVCRSIAEVLKGYSVSPVFKRPNDILVNGKKICGILIEAFSKGNRIEGMVIGVGLNVNAEGPELIEGATSLKAETGKTINRDRLLDQLLDRLKNDLMVS